MPCEASNAFSLLFSSVKKSRSRVTEVNESRMRRTSCSRALMYISFRSRWVLCKISYQRSIKIANGRMHLPLRLPIQLLPSRQGGFAVWFRPSSFLKLAIYLNPCQAIILNPGHTEIECAIPFVVFEFDKFRRNLRLLPKGLFDPLDSLAVITASAKHIQMSKVAREWSSHFDVAASPRQVGGTLELSFNRGCYATTKKLAQLIRRRFRMKRWWPEAFIRACSDMSTRFTSGNGR